MGQWTWQTYTEPRILLAYNSGRGGSSDRRYRLFACALARRLWDRLDHDALRLAVEVAERFADGQATRDEMARAHAAAIVVPTRSLRASRVAIHSADPTRHSYLNDVVLEAARTGLRNAGVLAVLRDIITDPSAPFALDPAWRTPTTASLAQAAYQERLMPSGELDLARLAVLADALEDQGASRILLEHLREPGQHVRGCWVIDALTGRS